MQVLTKCTWNRKLTSCVTSNASFSVKYKIKMQNYKSSSCYVTIWVQMGTLISTTWMNNFFHYLKVWQCSPPCISICNFELQALLLDSKYFCTAFNHEVMGLNVNLQLEWLTFHHFHNCASVHAHFKFHHYFHHCLFDFSYAFNWWAWRPCYFVSSSDKVWFFFTWHNCFEVI